MTESTDILDRFFNSMENLVCGKEGIEYHSSPAKMNNRKDDENREKANTSLILSSPSSEGTNTFHEYSSNIKSGDKILIFNEDTFNFYLGEPRCCLGEEQSCEER